MAASGGEQDKEIVNPNLLNMEPTERHATLNDLDVNELLETKDSKSTKTKTNFAVSTFRDYLRQKGQPVEFEDMCVERLAGLLKQFYVEVRKLNGEIYKQNALKGIRCGINRHLQNKCIGIDIIYDPGFIESNTIFRTHKGEVAESRLRGKNRV